MAALPDPDPAAGSLLCGLMRRMISAVELFVGLRYLRAKKRTRFVSFITLISLAGIALGVAALIVILSVMNGFEGELRDRLLSMTAHGYVTGTTGGSAFCSVGGHDTDRSLTECGTDPRHPAGRGVGGIRQDHQFSRGRF